MTGIENVDDFGSTMPDLSNGCTSSSSSVSLDVHAVASDITVDIEYDELKDVEVLEELQIPQPVLNGQLSKRYTSCSAHMRRTPGITRLFHVPNYSRT